MNQVIIRTYYGDELYSEIKSDDNIAPSNVPKVTAYLADKLAITAGKTAGHDKRRATTRRARKKRRNKTNITIAGGASAQQANG